MPELEIQKLHVHYTEAINMLAQKYGELKVEKDKLELKEEQIRKILKEVSSMEKDDEFGNYCAHLLLETIPDILGECNEN